MLQESEGEVIVMGEPEETSAEGAEAPETTTEEATSDVVVEAENLEL